MSSILTYKTAPRTSVHAMRVSSAPAIRVLHVINGEHYAGAERVQDFLALRLPDHGFEVGFACLKSGAFGPMRQAQKTSLYDAPMRFRLDLRPAAQLAKLIRREGYALVHTHNPRTALVGSLAAVLCRVPHVHHVHTQTRVEVGERWMSRIGAVVERHSLTFSAGLIGVSESVCRYLRNNGYARRRVWLVPNGVPASGKLLSRSRPRGVWTVGLLALFRPRKGLEVMLQAMAKLKSMGIVLKLRAVGCFETQEYEREIKQYANDLGLAAMIDWPGFRSDVNAELRQMDIFVLPSLLSEGMPMSVLEAMCAGTTVVCARVDGVTDVIRDGEDGLLASPGDPDDLARALDAIVGGRVDCDRMRASAHRRQAEMFSDQSMAQGVARIYKEVLKL